MTTSTEPAGTSPTAFGTVSREALAQQIVGRLLDLIRARELRAGAQLPPERELAVTMSVSRSSLREALRALAVMGVLEMRHGAGTYVSSLEPDVLVRQLGVALSLSDVAREQLFDARLAVEPAVCAMAATRMTDEAAEQLEASLRRAEHVLDDHEKFVANDHELHELISRIAGNALLSQFMSSIRALGVASRRETGAIPGQTERTIVDHRLIVAALLSGDPDAASAAMRAHVRRIQREAQAHNGTAAAPDDGTGTDRKGEQG